MLYLECKITSLITYCFINHVLLPIKLLSHLYPGGDTSPRCPAGKASGLCCETDELQFGPGSGYPGYLGHLYGGQLPQTVVYL